MQPIPSSIFKISDSSAAGETRRASADLARRLGFDETDQGNIAIIATEMAKNVAIHARRGEIHLRILLGRDPPGIELLALDKGPGMANIPQCMRDGFSTAHTAGIGLGAIQRLSSVFDIYSTQGAGTAVLSRLWPRAAAFKPADDSPWAAVSAPKSGEILCGDAFDVHQSPQQSTFLLADGLGHGPIANHAALEAVRIFQQNPNGDLPPLMDLIHAALRPTRGAAVSIARSDWAAKQVQFTGVGNVAGLILTDGQTRNMASSNGTMGHAFRKAQVFNYPISPGSVLILFSDGLATHWKTENYPGLTQRHPAIIAGVLYRDYTRERDDVTVLVGKSPSA